ncbi:hypothetical protein [Helicobacter cetorum]|uniref:hypothetical protein n=1 Tax=Helicobacter cetorum TaxID=138563 RepID=UPI000CF1636C|nr:hypothetical protein [Helicobacter cetorum]
MKFLGKWYLLFFIGFSSLVFVGCEQESYKHRHSHDSQGNRGEKLVRGLEDKGFSHGSAMFIAFVLLVGIGYIVSKDK